MTRQISETDWKRFRKLKPIALERFCRRVVAELGRVIADDEQSAYERYKWIYSRIQQRDRELADAFDGASRSTALRRLARIASLELLTAEELGDFSEETRKAIEILR